MVTTVSTSVPTTPPVDAPRHRRAVGVAGALGSGGLAIAGCLLIALADPSVPGRYGMCPFYATTGLWCPLCGSLRAVHHVTRGDIVGAAGSNLLLVLAAPVAVYAWARWVAHELGWRPPPLPRMPTGAWWGLLAAALVALVGFAVARNLTPYAWLAPAPV